MAQNNGVQHSYSHQNTRMTRPMVQTASPYHHKLSIPQQPHTLMASNENIIYAQDIASPYSFASSPLSHSNHSSNSNSTIVHAHDYLYLQPQQQQSQVVHMMKENTNNQYPRLYVPNKHDTMSMHKYNDILVQPQRYNYQSTLGQSGTYHRMSQIPMQQSSSHVHPDTFQRKPISISQHIPQISVNKETEPMKVAKDIEFYRFQQLILWKDLYKQYEKSYSIYTKVKMLISSHYNGNITEEIVGTFKLEQMVNKEKFQKIMEQSYSKFISDQMKQDFNITNTANNNKQIDGIYFF